jgi:hypothetical protein
MSDTTKSFAPSFPIARMEKRTSAKGTEYFSGYLGGARITLLKSNEVGRDGAEVWHLLMAEGKLFPLKTENEPRTQDAQATSARRNHSKSDFARPTDTGQRPAGSRLTADQQAIPF